MFVNIFLLRGGLLLHIDWVDIVVAAAATAALALNSAFYPSGEAESACPAGVRVRYVHLCWVSGNTV